MTWSYTPELEGWRYGAFFPRLPVLKARVRWRDIPLSG